MFLLRTWLSAVSAAPSLRRKLLTILVGLVTLVILLALLYGLASFAVGLGVAGLSAAASFLRRLSAWLLDAMPMIVVLVILTYLMGKPGKTIRKGTVELLNNVLVGLFTLVGVHVAKEQENKSKREDTDNDD